MKTTQKKVSGQNVRKVSAVVRGVSETVRRCVHGRPWTSRAARNAANNRPVPVWKQLFPALMISVSLLATLAESDWQVQAALYLLFGASFCFCDPFLALTRLFAPQSCNLLSFCQILSVIAIFRPSRGYLAVAGILVSCSLTMIYFMNVEWLAAYNWLLSSEVETALLYDAENRATKAWESHGRREMRTLLNQLGYESTDTVLNIYARPMYLCGYLHGHKKMVKVKQRIQSLEEKNQKYCDSLSDQKEQNKKLSHQMSEIQKENAEISQMLSEERFAYSELQKMYAESQSENKRLRMANAELIEDIQEPFEGEGLSEEVQIQRMLQRGLSIRKTAELLQIPKNRVEKAKKQKII